MSEPADKLKQRTLNPVSRLATHVIRLEMIVGGAGIAVIIVGALLIGGGLYDRHVVRSQLFPQKIFFPAPPDYSDLSSLAGKQVINGVLAHTFAEKQVARDLLAIAGGKTYSQVSNQARLHPTAALEQQTELLFRGTTIQGMLLNAWGWWTLGTLLFWGGIVVAVIGLIMTILAIAAQRAVARQRLQ